MTDEEAHWSAEFEGELRALINRLSVDAKTETPDYLLARLMTDTLRTYGRVRQIRDRKHPPQPMLETVTIGPADA